MKIDFETKCYENDWKHVLLTDKIFKLLDNCSFQFNERILYINNVNNYELVINEANKLINKKIIDKYIIVKDYSENALNFFDININSFNGGYIYSISELVSIYLSNADYLLHFSSDSNLDNKYNWINDAINIMNNNLNIIVANPCWSHDFSRAKSESIYEDSLFYYSYGLSDQCYLIKLSEFKNKIYGEYNMFSERYPIHGGNSFEKRVDSYMRNKNKLRITSKNSFYTHKNIIE